MLYFTYIFADQTPVYRFSQLSCNSGEVNVLENITNCAKFSVGIFVCFRLTDESVGLSHRGSKSSYKLYRITNGSRKPHAPLMWLQPHKARPTLKHDLP